MVFTKAYVTHRLEEAGATLLALPSGGYSPRLRVSHLDVVHSALEAYGWEGGADAAASAECGADYPHG